MGTWQLQTHFIGKKTSVETLSDFKSEFSFKENQHVFENKSDLL